MKNLVKKCICSLGCMCICYSGICWKSDDRSRKCTGYCGEKGYRGERRSSDAIGSGKVTYTKIEVAEVPEKVAAAVTAKYEGYTTKEAAKGSDNSYKLIIEKGDSTLTVYFNEAGEFLKEEAPQKEGTALV